MAVKKYQWFLTCIYVMSHGWQFLSAAPPVMDAFSDDINSCLFSKWKSVAISGNVECQSYGSDFKPLCYGLKSTGPALFAVCYNTNKQIPAFTAHVVKPVTGSSSDRPTFRKDKGKYGRLIVG
ncbi:uncharacterized protein LOC114575433 [Exaiptasia diaphana]|uniref:Uncharacterized protein n=1 Tax=Exaiptasia diaphana TaxID=2652724 RepID=A0A913YM04_EXADI|nr:uncharacterized protein LOC114575433 [Exaiptasia diaphana]